MLHRSIRTQGIDFYINDIQEGIYNHLKKKWGDLDVFGRVSIIIEDDKVKALFNNDDGDFLDVYLNDEKDGSVFFIDSEKHSTSDSITYTSDVSIVFMINLSQIFNSDNDSKAHDDVIEYLNRVFYDVFEISEIQKGVKNVMKGFDTSVIADLDYYPCHVFCVNGKISYETGKRCC